MAGWFRCRADSPKIPFYRRKYDIIALQETWTDVPFILNVYHAFELAALPGMGPGRLKGGLGILISTQLKVKCTEVAPLKPFAMAVHLSLERGFILFINVYLPPGRKKTEVKEIWVKLERYVSFLVIEYPKARIWQCWQET